jgi:arylsulfatase A-like enzyme/tetratricopeptide (TPR) repeat protein
MSVTVGWPAEAGRRTLRRIPGVLLVALTSACGHPPASAPANQPPRHLIIVTIDTLRADRLGAYGNTTIPTPNFDRIAAEGVRAIDASTHVPITRPAHTSLLTGRYPAEHGIRDNISLPLAADVPTLAETLKGQGFATAAFVSSFVLSTQSGLNRGFDHYDDAFKKGTTDEIMLFSSLQRRGDDTLSRVEEWLDSRPPDVQAKRTALWVHLYDPHDPYEPPEPFASKFADRPYDGEVAWTDTLLGRLRASLEARKMWDNALVIITADHGEALGEHDETGHGFFTYETTLKVPLVMRGPGLSPNATVNGTVRLVDVAPTALALLGVPPMPETTGVDLSPHLVPGGAPITRLTYAESLTPLLQYQWSDLRVIRDGPWKYILAPRPELYDLSSDPGETRDLATTETATAARLRTALEGLLRVERNRASSRPAATPALSADVLQKLGALGYVSPGAPKNSVAQGADPKDKIEEFRTLSGLMREGLTLLRQGRYAESISRFTGLQKAGSEAFQVYFYLGRAQLGLGRTRDAEKSFERTIEIMPNFTQAHVSLAEARLVRKDPQGAIAALQRGQRDAPNEPDLFDREGQVWQQLGDLPRAMAAYERVAALAPRDALVRWRMGEVVLTQGQPDRARELFRQATELDPTVADYWNSLGMVMGGAGDQTGAADAFRKALERDPKDARVAYNLGLVLMRAGDPSARAQFERVLALDPGFRPARERLAELGR